MVGLKEFLNCEALLEVMDICELIFFLWLRAQILVLICEIEGFTVKIIHST